MIPPQEPHAFARAVLGLADADVIQRPLAESMDREPPTADLARDHPVEIDLAAESLGDTLAYHGDQCRSERDESDEDQQDAEYGDHAASQCRPWAWRSAAISANAALASSLPS